MHYEQLPSDKRMYAYLLKYRAKHKLDRIQKQVLQYHCYLVFLTANPIKD